MDWQPIETAPKDGTPILVYRHLEPWRVIGWATWVDVQGISGWLSHGFYDPPGALGLAHPTHWMPLPEPPSFDWHNCGVYKRTATPVASLREIRTYYGEQTKCHAGQDGDCAWKDCPQLRDGEPEKSHRHCPLDQQSEER